MFYVGFLANKIYKDRSQSTVSEAVGLYYLCTYVYVYIYRGVIKGVMGWT